MSPGDLVWGYASLGEPRIGIILEEIQHYRRAQGARLFKVHWSTPGVVPSLQWDTALEVVSESR